MLRLDLGSFDHVTGKACVWHGKKPKGFRCPTTCEISSELAEAKDRQIMLELLGLLDWLWAGVTGSASRITGCKPCRFIMTEDLGLLRSSTEAVRSI